jgi:hypothetical protein
MDGRNQAIFVTPYIEHRLVINLIGTWEYLAQMGKIDKALGFHDSIPVFQSALCVWMLPGKLVQPLTGDDVHAKHLHETILP